jgi:pimeloyl-ACP methyl ester carboxylesterase
LNVEVDGHAAQPALLLLHGFMSSGLQWELNRDRLRRHFRLVVVELWGHGKSPAPEDPACYQVDRYLAELERIRADLGADQWLVCGQSFGAGIAIRYALANSERVAGLIVTNSRSALNDVSPDPAGGDLDRWVELDARSLPYHPCHAKRFPSELKSRMEAAADAIPAQALWQATATTARELSCRDVVGKLSVPTLLVNGRYERSFQADRDFAEAAIPGIEIVDLEAGHSVNVEAARAFEQAVIEFGQRCATRRRSAPGL